MIIKHLTDTVCEVVATARIRGGTRVVVLTARENGPYHFTVTTMAYDSTHPGDALLQGYYSGQCLTDLVLKARDTEAGTFAPRPDACSCWAKWDPSCGRPGCWGTRVTVAAVA